MTSTPIRAPEKGGSGRLYREVENITGYAPADGPLAEMLLTNDQTVREALAKEVATILGRGAAGDCSTAIILKDGIAVAATRARVAFRGEFADELHDLSRAASRKRQEELAAQAIERVETRTDDCKARNPGNSGALAYCLEYAVEDDLGRFSDADYEAVIPSLVKRAGFEGAKAERLIRHLSVLGRMGRDDREAQASRAYQAEWNDRAARRRERKGAGLPCFATYLINPSTGRTVEDEEREAAEIARADAEHVEVVMQSTVGRIAEAVREGAGLGAIVMIAFESGCNTRRCAIDGHGMIAEFVEAADNVDLADLFGRTIAAARECEGPAETEAAFTRLLADEGIAAPFAFTPEASAEPVEAATAVKAPCVRVESIEAHHDSNDDEAIERRLIERGLAEIKSNRDMSESDLLTIVRRVAYETDLIPAKKLSDLMISTSRQMTPYMHDAIRLSVDEASHAGADYDDASVEGRVEQLLKAIHAPITGQPGLAERNAEQTAVAMSPIGAKGPTPFAWKDPHTLPRRAWLYGALYIRKELTATIAPGGGGKTALTIVEALVLASGRPLLGIMPAKRCKVWIWSGEEPLEELQKRILAACEHHGLTAKDIDGWLFVDNFESFDFIIAEQTRDGTTVNQPKIDLLTRWLLNNGIDVLFVDPAISTHNVGENDNVAVQKWATAWKSVAVGANAAISLAHHAKKLGGQTATADDSRGARSFVDKCRIVRSLNPMTKEEAVRFQLHEEDRRYFFSIDPTEAKANMAPAVGGKDWFRSNSVMLGAKRNGPLDPGESIGVVGRWKPPAPADKLDEDKVEAICATVGGRSWRAANNKFKEGDSIGAPIAKALGLDTESPSDMRLIKDTYARLLKEGHVVEEKVPDKNGTPRPYARWCDED